LGEVAARANVSESTVSRVLNDSVSISAETSELVRQVAAELGYQPNKAARALATGRTYTVALWTTNLRSVFYAEVVHHINQEVTKHGYELMVNYLRTVDNTTLNTHHLLSWPFDGILAVDLPRSEIYGLDGSLVEAKPFVNVGAYVITTTDYVRVDFREATVEAVHYLDTAGCRRIAYLVPDWFEWFEAIDDDRLVGYRLGLADIGLEPEYIITGDESEEVVEDHLRAYIKRHGCPDGLFCYNDDMAIVVYQVLQSLGLRIPDDVAVIACNGARETRILTPPLSTIVQPIGQMCAVAWSFLEKRIADPKVALQQQVIAAHCEFRGSTKR